MTLLGAIRLHTREVTFAVQNLRSLELYFIKFLFTIFDQTPIQLVSYKAKKNKPMLMVSLTHNSGSIDQPAFRKKLEVNHHYNET